MFIELLPYYSYLLFLLSIALLGFSAGVFCSSPKCQGTPYDLAPRHRTQQRTQQAVRRRTPTLDRIDKSDAESCSKTSKNLGSRGIPRTTVSCKQRDPELIMSTSTGKVDEKREEVNTSKAKILDMKKREEWGMMQKELDNTSKGKVQDKEKREKGTTRESNPRPVWLRSLSVGKPSSGQDSNLGSQPLNFALHESKAEEKAGNIVERKASLTGEEVKELADAFIARVRQRMRVQRQESLARQASYEARLDRSS